MKKYIQPTCLVINLVPERIIAKSIEKASENFNEGSMKFSRRRLWSDDEEE